MDDGVIWTSMSGVHISKTNFDFSKNGYYINTGGFGKFISKEEAFELAKAILAELESENKE